MDCDTLQRSFDPKTTMTTPKALQMRRNGMCDLMLTSTSFTTLSKLLNFSASVSYSVKRYNAAYFRAVKVKSCTLNSWEMIAIIITIWLCVKWT